VDLAADVVVVEVIDSAVEEVEVEAPVMLSKRVNALEVIAADFPMMVLPVEEEEAVVDLVADVVVAVVVMEVVVEEEEVLAMHSNVENALEGMDADFLTTKRLSIYLYCIYISSMVHSLV